MNIRLKRALSQFDHFNIDALIVNADINVSYLSKYPSSDSWLFLTANDVYYITDFRYIHEVTKGLRGIKPVQYRKSAYQTLFEIAHKEGVNRIGFDEDHWTLRKFKVLKRYCPKGSKLVPANDIIEQIREIKESSEIQLIRQGLEIHQKTLKYIKKYIKPNTTEKAVFKKLEAYVKSQDVEFSFSPIVASGPNSSYPHAHVTLRKIKNNEPVLLDMGVDYKGYKTDLTRMFFLGKIPNLLKEVTAHVHEAQQRAISRISEGVPIARIDQEARKYLESKNLAKYFGHALGHGVGLQIHENPKLYHTVNKPLKAGMVITIEPAVYIPNKFGVRLEEMVLVKKKGCEVISGHIN